MKIMVEIIGRTAAVVMLSTYVLLTTRRLRSLSPAYQWLNVLSGAGFILMDPQLRSTEDSNPRGDPTEGPSAVGSMDVVGSE